MYSTFLVSMILSEYYASFVCFSRRDTFGGSERLTRFSEAVHAAGPFHEQNEGKKTPENKRDARKTLKAKPHHYLTHAKSTRGERVGALYRKRYGLSPPLPYHC